MEGPVWRFTTPDIVPPSLAAGGTVPVPGSTLTTGSAVFELAFSEQVNGVDAGDLILTGDAATGALVHPPVQGPGTTWCFPVAGLTDGTLTVTLAPDPDDIEDNAGNDLAPIEWEYEVTISPGALSFDGDDFVEIPDHDAWNLAGDPFTVSCWAKFTSHDGDRSLVSHWNPDGHYGWLFYYWADQGKLVFEWSSTGSDWFLPAVPWSPVNGQWYHLAVARDDQDGLRFFVDGVQVGDTQTMTGSVYHNTAPLRIAASNTIPYGISYQFHGNLDEVRIWSTARSPDQIATNMYNRPGDDEPGLAANWRMDDGLGQVLHDFSGQGHHGRLGSTAGEDDADPAWIEGEWPYHGAVIWYRDADGDGHGSGEGGSVYGVNRPQGFAAVDGDCDDTDPDVHPGAEEVWNGIDDDCDGGIDEGLIRTFYRDADGDGFGSAASGTVETGIAPEGYVESDTDCDDADKDVNPGEIETCNGIDDDCDGAIDEGLTTTFYRDADEDGFGDPFSPLDACTQPEGYVPNRTDCDDADPDVNPGATETCNGVDDDCDGAVDEGLTTTFYRDADGDGFGDPLSPLEACTQPAGYVLDQEDCNDIDPDIHPGAVEVCNGEDDNCDGAVDEGVTTTFYRDADGDGFGDPSVTTEACTLPQGYVTGAGDCDDTRTGVHPGAEEIFCNGMDDNCDGLEECPNRPPFAPEGPTPEDLTGDVAVDEDLSWTCTDPDTGDTLTYDVYLGTDLPLTLAASDMDGATWDPGTLEAGTTYYWRVTARDAEGLETEGPVWAFTTDTPEGGTFLFHDDFNDESIDGSKWITWGNRVTEHDGMLDLEINTTDGGGFAETVEFAPLSSLKLTVTHMMHGEPSYNGIYYFERPGFEFYLEAPGDYFTVYWPKTDYGPSYYSNPAYYDKVMVKAGAMFFSDLTSSSYYDQWITSVIEYDQATGLVTLDMGGDGTQDFTVNIPEASRHPVYKVRISGYGWWTGHRHRVDDFRLESDSAAPGEPPNEPADPGPADGAVDVGVNADLSWTGGDPDTGDAVAYDVYFGTDPVPPLAAVKLTGSTFDPGALTVAATYYWRVVARDAAGNVTPGPVWSFTATGVDSGAPTPPSGVTAQPGPGAWTNDTLVEVSWQPGGDPGGLGVAGYSLLWDETPSTVPDAIVDTTDSTAVSPALEEGQDHYLHMVTVDLAGNISEAVHLGPFMIDTTVPEAVVTYSVTVPTSGNVTAEVMLNEGFVTSPGGITHTFGENDQWVFIFADEAGNTGEVTAVVDWIDRTPPEIAVTGIPEAGISGAAASIMISGTDAVSYRFRLDGGEYGEPFPIDQPIVLAGLSEGPHTLVVIGCDAVGNWQTEDTAVVITWEVNHVAAGDINDDGGVDLADAILCLQVVSGTLPAEPVHTLSDLDGDKRVGLTEAVWVMRTIADE